MQTEPSAIPSRSGRPGPAHLVRFGGARPGPTLLAATGPCLLDPLVVRLRTLPTLGWMHGTLLVTPLSQVGALARPVDDTLSLAFSIGADGMPTSGVDDAYWTLMRKCAALGMIAGRGLPYRGRPD